MKLMKFAPGLFLILAAFMMSPSLAFAIDKQACIDEARSDLVACTTVCKEQFIMDKDGCRDVDHECADACRDGRETCVTPILSDLEACKGLCYDALVADKANCRVLHAGDPLGLDACIDGAQVKAFMCRDSCREKVAEELKACRIGFRTCIKACPPAPAE